MNSIVQLNLMVDKELELEHQGQPRTRRWIGDANQAADASWYQRRIDRVPATLNYNNDAILMAEAKPQLNIANGILQSLGNLFNTRRQSARSEG